MPTQIKTTLKKLYEQDYNQWVELTVRQIQEKKFEGVDWENSIEEVADLSKREISKLKSLLTRLWEHLLKLGYWQSEREYNQGHWKGEIRNLRKQIEDILKTSPSLKPYLLDIWEECYHDAREILSDRSQLPIESFPLKPIGTIEQVLDENWLPL
jgi:hypothetical protein